MLRHRYRLHRSADVRRVRQNGRVWRHPLAILIAAPQRAEQEGQSAGGPGACSRFAFLASRRVGMAVARNRAKRVLREAVRLHLQDIRPGWDCVMIARGTTANASFVDVETAVLQLLSRAQMLSSRPAHARG